jgi:hypothetical protein
MYCKYTDLRFLQPLLELCSGRSNYYLTSQMSRGCLSFVITNQLHIRASSQATQLVCSRRQTWNVSQVGTFDFDEGEIVSHFENY